MRFQFFGHYRQELGLYYQKMKKYSPLQMKSIIYLMSYGYCMQDWYKECGILSLYNKSLGMINSNFKLKSKQTKEEGPSRKIRTEINENPKKISFYLTRMPLQEKKQTINQSDNLNAKKTKNTKSILFKNQPNSKLITQVNDRNLLQSVQKQAINKLFNNLNKNNLSTTQINKKDLSETKNNLSGLQRYVFQEKVGSGTFGTVHKARDKKTLEVVAIKKVFQDRKYKNRELQILKMLKHPNVLEMKDSFISYDGDKQYLNVVMDHFQGSLYDTIVKYKKRQEMPRLMVKVLSFQLFRSLLYLSFVGIAHRDIKPQNILVNQTNWKLVMCDFGSAKRLIPNQPNIAYICSRCYRAPELIFGNTNYSTQIDIWSVGCVLGELVMMQPIFRGDSNIDQLVEVIRVLGTPTEAQIVQMNPDCDLSKYIFPKIVARSWSKVLNSNSLGEEFVDLLSRILTYSPNKRLSPLQALQHPFFDQIKEEHIYKKLRKQMDIPDLFNFRQTKEGKINQLDSIIPKWYLKSHF